MKIFLETLLETLLESHIWLDDNPKRRIRLVMLSFVI